MKIIITRADGGVSVMTLAAWASDVEAELAKWKVMHAGEYVSHREMAESESLPDRTFRNAWTDTGSKIDHNMTKAQEVAKDILRAARTPKLAALDVAFLRAAETQDADQLNAITAQKQALRDITADPSITNAKTVKGLASALTKLKQSIEG